MDLQQAVKLMMDARSKLRTKEGVESPDVISLQMMRLTQATGAVEEHLAELEEELELQEMNKFVKYTEEGSTANEAKTRTGYEVGALKGQVAKFKRYVNSSWQIVSVAQSRWNHLSKSTTGQI